MIIASHLRENLFSILRMNFQARLQLAFERENKRRKDAGEKPLTKTMLWKAAHVSSSACSHWFSGANEIDLDTALKISPLLRVNTLWLFNESKPINENISPVEEAIDLAIKEPKPTEYMNENERLLLQGYRVANNQEKGFLLYLAKKAIEEAEATKVAKTKLRLVKSDLRTT